MSAIKDLTYDIEQLYIEGFNSLAIAEELECPIEVVLAALKAMNVADAPQEELSPYETFNS
jgi:hypothetical protein